MAPSLPATERATDVLVIGGGIIGLMLALRLAQSGVEVVIADAANRAGSTVNAGSLHVQMQSRFIRLETPERVEAVQRHQMFYVHAVRAWEALVAELNEDIELFVEGGVMLAETEEQYRFLEQKCRAEEKLGLRVQMLGREEIRRVAPYLSEHAIGAEFCADEGKINTLLANRAIERAVRATGVRLLRPLAVTGLRQETSGFIAETAAGELRAKRVVNAAGGGAGVLARMVGVAIPVESEPLHMNVTEPVAPMIRHLVQHADRQLTLKQFANGNVVIGGGRPAFFDPATGLPSVYRTSIEGNLSLALHLAPWLAEVRLLRTWAGVNAKTDGMPVLGEAPGVPGFFCAVSGDAGYTLGPFSAELLADVMLGRRPRYDIADFSVARFA
jgi:glycine/D-amino acid oxidase-like deaminating enzyme